MDNRISGMVEVNKKTVCTFWQLVDGKQDFEIIFDGLNRGIFDAKGWGTIGVQFHVAEKLGVKPEEVKIVPF